MELLYKEEAYEIFGICMEVHNQLGSGFLEIVYKDAVEHEVQKKKILYSREVEYMVHYKDIILPHRFYADFVVHDKIILEIKAVSKLTNEHVAQALNYLAVSKHKLALLVNFGAGKLDKFIRAFVA